MFTFLVGPEEEKFMIHSHAISKLSCVFDCMMNGSMKEAVEKVARLPTVDPQIFLGFTTFCYTGFYEKKELQQISEKMTGREKNEKEIKLAFQTLDILGLWLYHCHSCRALLSLKSSWHMFPRCINAHVRPRHPARTWCVPCGDYAVGGFDYVCEKCIGMLLLKFSQLDFIDPVYQNLWEQAKIVRKRNAFAKITAKHEAVLKLMLDTPTPSTDLLLHAKMSVFAEQYCIDGLQAASLAKLCTALIHHKMAPDQVDNIAHLLEYVYENTCSENDGTLNSLLRQLISAFAIDHAPVLLKSSAVQAVLLDNSDLALDMLKAAVAMGIDTKDLVANFFSTAN